MMGVGALGVGATNMLFTAGVNLTNASDTALIYAVVPVWGMILGSVLGLERPTLGCPRGGDSLPRHHRRRVRGVGRERLESRRNLLVLGATVCWGSYTAFSAPPRKVLAVGGRGLYHVLWRSGCLTVGFARYCERGVGRDEGRCVGGGRLLDRPGRRIRVLRLAEGAS